MSALQNSVVFLKCVGCQSPVDKKAMLAFQSSILIFHCLNISYHVGSAKLVSSLSVLSALDFVALDSIYEHYKIADIELNIKMRI